jgi:hypothetical protein
MAHFAEINSDNIVLRVLVVSNDHEHRGQEYLANQLGLGGTWIQTSYNNNFRVKFAAIGDTYNPELDRFEPKQPHPSMIWDEDAYCWIPATPSPGENYDFNLQTGEWEVKPTE